jgi:NADH-quinone oxidoreductase subunit M
MLFIIKIIPLISFIIQLLIGININVLNYLKNFKINIFSIQILLFLQLVYLYLIIYQINNIYIIYLDFLGLIFCFLVILIITLCILWEFNRILLNSNIKLLKNIFKFKNSIICLLSLEFLLINLFLTNNFFIFYILFEISLIPTFYLIVINGALQRKFYAGYIFMLYPILGSIFLLIIILYFYLILNNLEFLVLSSYSWSIYEVLVLSIFLIFGFAFKIPIWPFHYWLIEAHVQASTSGSVVLASLLLKIGTFGISKWLILIFNTNIYLEFIVLIISIFCILSIIIPGLSAVLQFDIKKLIAYSSVMHMSYVVLGLCSGNFLGLIGAILLMLVHGFVASGLFFLIGVIYDRYGIKLSFAYSGLSNIMPNLSFVFLIFTLFNVSFPGTASFLAEFFILISLLNKYSTLMIICCLLTYLNSLYSFWLIMKVFYGVGFSLQISNLYSDLIFIEMFILSILILFVILLGLSPMWLIYFLINNGLFT